MAEHEDQNPFPLRELQGPLERAREVARQHSASAPDGGTGPGHHTFSWDRLADAVLDAEADLLPGGLLARHMLRNWPRYRHVLAALGMAGPEAQHLIVAETGTTVETVLAGFLPGLLDIAKWVGLGAVIGAGIGALGGPADEITVPGGALAGAEVGLWIANSLGLAGLLLGVVKNLGRFVEYASEAAEIAWYAGDDARVPLHTDLVNASKLFAAALAELWLALLQALVAEVLRRAGQYTAKRLAANDAFARALDEVTKQISGSKLGRNTGEWFRQNFEPIQRRLLRSTSISASKSDLLSINSTT